MSYYSLWFAVLAVLMEVKKQVVRRGPRFAAAARSTAKCSRTSVYVWGGTLRGNSATAMPAMPIGLTMIAGICRREFVGCRLKRIAIFPGRKIVDATVVSRGERGISRYGLPAHGIERW